jgi:hypothetical protein
VARTGFLFTAGQVILLSLSNMRSRSLFKPRVSIDDEIEEGFMQYFQNGVFLNGVRWADTHRQQCPAIMVPSRFATCVQAHHTVVVLPLLQTLKITYSCRETHLRNRRILAVTTVLHYNTAVCLGRKQTIKR